MRRWNLVLFMCLAFVCCKAEDDEEHDFASVKIGGQKTLDCKTDDDVPLSWTFTSQMTNETSTLMEVEDEVIIDKNKIVLKNVEEEDLGVYRCFIGDEEEKSFFVDISLKLKKLAKSFSIDEGSSTKDDLKCTMISSGQEVSFKWFTKPFEPEDPADKDKITPICSKSEDSDCSIPDAQALFNKKDKDAPVVPLAERSEITSGVDENGLPWSVLTIRDTDLTDRKIYICEATLVEDGVPVIVDDCKESKQCDQAEIILRVKDPLAAVWPFCGIVVEVVLLCIIIFFCEKRQSAEKDDYDEGSNGAPGSRK